MLRRVRFTRAPRLGGSVVERGHDRAQVQMVRARSCRLRPLARCSQLMTEPNAMPEIVPAAASVRLTWNDWPGFPVSNSTRVSNVPE